MTTNARIGHGVTFQIQNDNSPTALTSVGEVLSVTPPGMARDAIDATHSASPNGWREFIAGLKDGGEASVEINYVPGAAGYLQLLNQFDTITPSTCRITFPDTSRFDFDAILTGIDPSAPVDDKMTATVTFKVSGQPLLTQAA